MSSLFLNFQIGGEYDKDFGGRPSASWGMGDA